MHTTRLKKVGGSVMLTVPPALLNALSLDAPGGLVRVQSGPERYPSTKSPGRLQRCASGRCLWWLPGVV